MFTSASTEKPSPMEEQEKVSNVRRINRRPTQQGCCEHPRAPRISINRWGQLGASLCSTGMHLQGRVSDESSQAPEWPWPTPASTPATWALTRAKAKSARGSELSGHRVPHCLSTKCVFLGTGSVTENHKYEIAQHNKMKRREEGRIF